MPRIGRYSPAGRQIEKESLRASDAAALLAGSISPQALRERNGFFSSLEILDSSVVCQDTFA